MNKIFALCIIALSIKLSTQQYDVNLSNLESNPMYKDMMNCGQHEDTSTCSNVQMTNKIYQCCRFHTVWTDIDYGSYDSPETVDICNVWVAQDFTDDQIKIMQKVTKKL